jgi:hypothetical protein
MNICEGHAPFQAVLLENSGQGKEQEQEQVLTFITDMAEEVTADESHPLSF